MKDIIRFYRFTAAIAALLSVILVCPRAYPQTDPLPSWNNGVAKQSILSFVKHVTDKSNSTYVEPQDRIATFDQDGTLWVEHPLYTQAVFALDRVRELAPQHPEWKQRDPFKAIISGDREAIGKFSEADWEIIVAATHSGMATKTFLAIVKQWIATAEHPRFRRRYTELVYQPMLEVTNYLRANGFRIYIVTGGGQEFVRAYSQRIYGIPLRQIIGSSVLTKYEYHDGKPVLMREPKVFFIDDHAGKAIGINLFIGKRPCAAFGNSTGDQQMMEWTQVGNSVKLMMLVLHDDAKREYAYGPAQGLPNTKVGAFSQKLYDEAKAHGWVVISMKNDWKRIFAFAQ